jgi:hypothetical protein
MPLFPFVLLALCILCVMGGAMWWANRRPVIDAAALPEGYISDPATLKAEFDLYNGPRDDYPTVNSRFRSAADLAAQHNLPAVANVLESVAKSGNLPVIFHNLGIVYAGLGDYGRAAESFREALAHNPEYLATRKFLREAKGIPGGSAEPHTREREPNNDNVTANVIALRAPVGGEIAGGTDSTDFFRVNAPPAPRDLISIEVANHTASFAPRLRVYDAKFRSQEWGDQSAEDGGAMKVTGGPEPNSSLTVSLTSDDGKTGAYLLTVTPLKAFDRYEPNDEIMAARTIAIGEEISANIMDNADGDFFTFVSPRKGAVAVEVRNRSQALTPVLVVYNKDRRNIGVAQDATKPGANLRHMIEAAKDEAYYLQVSSQAGTSGAYVLRVD